MLYLFDMLITSKSNPIIKTIKSLDEKKFRKELNLYIVEGIKPVKECIASGQEIYKIICVEGLESSFPDAITVTENVFKYVSSEKTPQGALAVIKAPQMRLQVPQKPCLLLDRIQDPGNLGTIIRTANAAGYEEIYTVNCADPYSPKAVRASMGGIFFVKIYQGSYEEIFSALDGVPLICADTDGEDIFTHTPPKLFCLCVGNEGSGLSDEVKNRAARTVSIPMRSACESLNAAVSAGIAMYALRKNQIER